MYLRLPADEYELEYVLYQFGQSFIVHTLSTDSGLYTNIIPHYLRVSTVKSMCPLLHTTNVKTIIVFVVAILT